MNKHTTGKGTPGLDTDELGDDVGPWVESRTVNHPRVI